MREIVIVTRAASDSRQRNVVPTGAGLRAELRGRLALPAPAARKRLWLSHARLNAGAGLAGGQGTACPPSS